jgi:hypothetical protein
MVVQPILFLYIHLFKISSELMSRFPLPPGEGQGEGEKIGRERSEHFNTQLMLTQSQSIVGNQDKHQCRQSISFSLKVAK